MIKKYLMPTSACLLVSGLAHLAEAEEFKLRRISVVSEGEHPSQKVRDQVEDAYNSSRSDTEVNGAVLQNLNPVNKLDGLRYHASGLINQPGNGNRFGGGTKIRTFGDWGAAESIDGLPAIMSSGQEGGGFSNTMIPTIALDNIQVKKGGRAVSSGDGTDGGVLQVNIKSGRGYTDHQALSLDQSSVHETQLQGEFADSDEKWDYYIAGKGFYGDYDGDPDNMDLQSVLGGVSKVGWNPSKNTRAEFLAIYDRSEPTIFRNGDMNKIKTDANLFAVTVDHRLSETQSFDVGLVSHHSQSLWPARSRDRSTDNRIAYVNQYITKPVNDAVTYNGSLGVEYKQTVSKRDGQWENTFDDYALISQNSLVFKNNLTVTAGLRSTWFNNDIEYQAETQADNLVDDQIISYQLGTAFSINKSTRLRFSTASGFNRFYSKYGNFGTDALAAEGAGDEVVESQTLEVGLNHAFSNGFIDIAAYSIVQDNVPRRNGGQLENMEVAQSGLEVDYFIGLTERISFAAGFMHIFDLEATRADGTQVNGNIFWDGQTTSVPENQFNVRGNYYLSESVQVWGAAYNSSGYEAVAADGDVTERDGFTRLDVGANWQLHSAWHTRVKIENLGDERDFGQTIAGTPVSNDGELGRIFWVGMDVSF